MAVGLTSTQFANVVTQVL